MTRVTTLSHLSHPAQLAQAFRDALTGLAADLEVLTGGHLAVTSAEIGWTLRGLRLRLQGFFELLEEHPDVAGDADDLAHLRDLVTHALDRLETRAA